jgi:2-polyprenyl-3-methyl-5-hydroxy-6-metoxy-1,4-benzoquinol methylase
MNKSVIDAFWRKRSAAGATRWSDKALLEYETGWLTPLVPENEACILDLGSGPGELSSRLLRPGVSLTLVDKYPNFLKHAPTGPGIQHICCDIVAFNYPQDYDLILLFGVVTHLTAEEESSIYLSAAQHLKPAGILVVKNQVSIGAEKVTSGFSAALQQEYYGRYPALQLQAALLESRGLAVSIKSYPDHFNPWPDTRHVAFICRQKAPT